MPRESKTNKQARIIEVNRRLGEAFPRSRCALVHESPFQLLIATLMSAQTTDTAVNAANRLLFAKFPDQHAMAAAPPDAIESSINTIGLWRAKSKHIRETSHALRAYPAGEIPRELDELVKLPGVGRKTASAVLGQAFGIAAGLTVDTHMLRIHDHLRLSRQVDATKMALELEQLLPQSDWISYTHRIIDFGRLVCVARRPRCGVCPLAELCPSKESAAIGYKPANDAKEPASAKGLSWLAWDQFGNGVTAP